MLTEGWQEGLELGQRNGRIAEAREVLFRLGRIRFGRLVKATREKIEVIDDLSRLEQLSERLLTATSWADLLAERESLAGP